MKVQVTIELNEEQRIAVGLLETNKLVACSREEARSYATELVMASVDNATDILVRHREETANEIRESMGLGG